MPRIARTVLAGLPHHITQRGNRREDVFFLDEDREIYLAWLAIETTIYALRSTYQSQAGLVWTLMARTFFLQSFG